ncbi:dephospho-CoA kinase [Pasteuria penetrans]|uniref:dephospho-CoA kinase n=1 Tax=Pasteuria penetrans TaxID=86005 RepID=UPI000FBFB16B|nr:dephospho-CoA kinase [Pasteuria penetrans]
MVSDVRSWEGRLGLTGGIATGKSTVAAMLARFRGVHVIDADRIARAIVQPGAEGWRRLRVVFGSRFFDENGVLQRNALAGCIFSCPEQRRRVEELLHPCILEGMREEERVILKRFLPRFIVWEVPLLFEACWVSYFPEGIVLVYVPQSVQRERLRMRDRLPEVGITQRLSAQWDIEQKRSHATWIIDNQGTRAETEEQVNRLWEDFRDGDC